MVQEIQIFGPILTYARYLAVKNVILEGHENYQKRSYRNRYHISGPNEVVKLSIPLIKGKNYRTPIHDVRIAYNEPWVSNHIHTIQSCYGSSPYFIHYAEPVFDLLRSGEPYLFNLCKASLQLMIKFLNIQIKVSETKAYYRNYNEYLDWRNVEKVNDPSESPLQYNQVFKEKFGFVGGLSILDLLFCVGPESTIWLKKLNSLST